MKLSELTIIGLGPNGWERIPPSIREILLDPNWEIVVRTVRHPAASTLASLRSVKPCDDIYHSCGSFEQVYDGIVERVLVSGERVIYAVPGSPFVGELAVSRLRARAAEEGISVQVIAGESFLDVIWDLVEIDPLADGFRLLNGHDLPDPLVFDRPTVIGQVDTPLMLGEVAARLSRALPEETMVTVVVAAGGPDETVVRARPDEIDQNMAGDLTSLFVPKTVAGWYGVFETMRRLRVECPWDRKQTHRSLVRYLVEETFELVGALSLLGQDEDDFGAYAEVEEELGDLLLQILFHTVIAEESGGFRADDVAEQLRRKLVRRHPHVFGDVSAPDAETVKTNWDKIKRGEKGKVSSSLMDGVPAGLPGISRSAEVQRRAGKVGFDWHDPEAVIEKILEEIDEVRGATTEEERYHELGDLAFSVVNLARHLKVEPETALMAAAQRFEDRFRAMEDLGSLEGLSLEQLDALWERVKQGLT